ncbi:MAG: CDGSH iron-sulfur domain-containing protein [Rikenellaceae bacterium]
MTKLEPAAATVAADVETIRVVVLEDGGYLLHGAPYISQQFILPDEMQESWIYREGAHFATGNGNATGSESETGNESAMGSESSTGNKSSTGSSLLCRCGASHNKPFCDGTHAKVEWDSRLTASMDRLLDGARYFEGEELLLSDNESYCCYARFCHPSGGAWHLTEDSADPESRNLAIREASMCPSARLMAWGRGEDTPYEFDFKPSVSLLEDPAAECSAGVWLRGGVVVERQSGERYERRNRVVLCRCGKSHNKPYCDGAHAAERWHDGLPDLADGEQLPDGELEIL